MSSEQRRMENAWLATKDAPAVGQGAADVLDVLARFVAWSDTYPSSRIYNHAEIVRIAAEHDAIVADARAILAALRAPSAAPTPELLSDLRRFAAWCEQQAERATPAPESEGA